MIKYKVKLKIGKKYSICSCGKSKILPYCDNEHRSLNLENNTNYKSIKLFPENDCTLEIKSSTWINSEDKN